MNAKQEKGREKGGKEERKREGKKMEVFTIGNPLEEYLKVVTIGKEGIEEF